jgi:prolyl-tRNA synthetase
VAWHCYYSCSNLRIVSVLTVATAFILQLMQDLGVIRQASPGAFHLLPLGERSLQKLIRIVDDEMGKIHAQKLLLPLLTSGELWKSTGMCRRLR